LGYANRDKKLVIIPEEAETVRWIFRKYLELGSLGALLQELRRVGIRTKVQKPASGQQKGGIPFRRGALAYLLKNRCYVGEVFHRGEAHAADHEPILDRETFDAVQASLKANGVARTARLKASPFLLTGLIFDSAGNRMSPVHTTKRRGVRYRYYASQALLQADRANAGQVTRVPAPDIEALIAKFVQGRFGVSGPASQAREIIEKHISKIGILPEKVEVEFIEVGTSDTRDTAVGRLEMVTLDWRREPFVAIKGVAHEPKTSRPDNARARDALLAAIGKAKLWTEEIMAGGTTAEIARREAKSDRQIRLLLPLAFTPPATVKRWIDTGAGTTTISDQARAVPLIWPEP
jgi:hypothetical protein